MPYLETPGGHSMFVDEFILSTYGEHSATIRGMLDEYDRAWCESCESADCDMCPDCGQHDSCYCEDEYGSGGYDEEIDRDGLLPYSYLPPGGYTFHGEGPAYYGLEIEVTSDNSWETLSFARSRLETVHGTLGYLKSDGSVNGFELVTPPMSYEWAMENWPWELLPALRDYGCRAIYRDNGIHIHVSRAAFGTPAHLFRWMKLFYRNADEITRIARRESTWGAFDGYHKRAQFAHAKKHMDPDKREQRVCEARERYQLAHTSAERSRWRRIYGELTSADDTQGERYSAINTTNIQTLEVRVFASTLNPRKAKHALQLVAGSVEYTRKQRGTKSWDWPSFAAWLADNRETYPELAELESDRLLAGI